MARFPGVILLWRLFFKRAPGHLQLWLSLHTLLGYMALLAASAFAQGKQLIPRVPIFVKAHAASDFLPPSHWLTTVHFSGLVLVRALGFFQLRAPFSMATDNGALKWAHTALSSEPFAPDDQLQLKASNHGRKSLVKRKLCLPMG